MLYAANDKDQNNPIATKVQSNNEGEFVFVDADNFPITIDAIIMKTMEILEQRMIRI